MNSTDNLSYIGKVKIDYVRKDGKVVKSSTIKNTGMSNLFSFLQRCFAGDLGAMNIRPDILSLYTGSSDPKESQGSFPWGGTEVGDGVPCGDDITYKSATDSGGSVTYRFVFPANRLLNVDVNLLTLSYSGAVNPSAYIYLKDGDIIQIDSSIENLLIT